MTEFVDSIFSPALVPITTFYQRYEFRIYQKGLERTIYLVMIKYLGFPIVFLAILLLLLKVENYLGIAILFFCTTVYLKGKYQK